MPCQPFVLCVCICVCEEVGGGGGDVTAVFRLARLRSSPFRDATAGSPRPMRLKLNLRVTAAAKRWRWLAPPPSCPSRDPPGIPILCLIDTLTLHKARQAVQLRMCDLTSRAPPLGLLFSLVIFFSLVQVKSSRWPPPRPLPPPPPQITAPPCRPRRADAHLPPSCRGS